MENFDTRKKEYLDYLRKNLYLLDKMSFKNNPEIEDKMIELLLNPSDENELKYANSVVGFISDIDDLEQRCKTGRIKIIPLPENRGINLLIDIINAYKNKAEIESVFVENQLMSADIIYGTAVAYMADIENTIEYMIKECGLDIHNEIDLKLFQLYLDKASAVMKFGDSPDISHSFLKVDNVEQAYTLFTDFHKLCEEGKIEKNRTFKKQA